MFSKKYKINISRDNLEPHEIFLDRFAKSKEEEMGITQKKFERSIGDKSAYLVFVFFAFFLVILLGRIFYLQVASGREFSDLSEKNRIRNQYVQAQRGVIYDKNLKQLVSNSPAYDLICDKRDLSALLSDNTDEIDKMAGLIGKNPEEIKQEIKDSVNSQVLIFGNLPQQTLVLLESQINNFPGFQIVSNTVRDYADGSFFSHLLGYTGKINKDEFSYYKDYSISDYIGKTGLEKSYEDVLRGTPGVIQVEKDALDKEKSQKVQSQPEDGKSLILNIDSGLQEELADSLQKYAGEMNLKKAAAVAIDPRNGAIMAMVSLPSFDNNIFSKGVSIDDLQKIQNDPSKPFLNRAISGQYPPGSTIKPFIASGVLQENIISPDKKIIDNGFIDVKSPYDPSVVYHFGGLEAPGQYDLRNAIAYSANIYFYTVGGGYGDQQGLGPTRIKKYLEMFGMGKEDNIDLPAEANGFVPSPEWKKQAKKQNWSDGDTYHFAIGQGDLSVTVLQMATAYAAIANGGTLYQPEVVKAIVDNSNKTKEIIKPKVVSQNFIDSSNLQIIREGMKLGAEVGTGRYLSSLPFKTGSKTGTAQTNKDGYYDAWAATFAPYDNPQIVIVAVVEDVEGYRALALDASKDALAWYFAR